MRIIEYLVGPDAVVREIHGDWDEFAEANAAPGLSVDAVVGRPLDEFVEGSETRLVYKALIDRIRRTGEPTRFTYRCDGPTCRRFMEMRLEPADPDMVRFRSRVVREERRDAQPLLDVETPRSEEILTMCSWCKKVRTDDSAWLEVEDYVERARLMEAPVLPRLSHGMCPSCEAEFEDPADPAA